jgi:hypothetical protein
MQPVKLTEKKIDRIVFVSSTITLPFFTLEQAKNREKEKKFQENDS